MQIWGAQIGARRLQSTDIRGDESSSRVPSDQQGRSCRNAPEWGAAAAIRQALLAWSGAACREQRITNSSKVIHDTLFHFHLSDIMLWQMTAHYTEKT
jgi:hypothetical protein